ncbi:hypothetical protein JOL79_23675 [Microbispora sp. RL4-1S]|uniref:Uncharacterized protein n=1 Tax=Microbispora oryzae TaxID=2806554 RepID=A0A941AL40_9ACTN|nr:hypothetical protein [Microbispora oryzae]MBP2706812.1 hypothetical protein [Microbispora oryzae]
MSTEPVTDVGTALGRVVEMFGALCADPDNLDLAQDADRTLADLNRLLADQPTPA